MLGNASSLLPFTGILPLLGKLLMLNGDALANLEIIKHALRMHNEATLRIQVIIILIVRFIYGARGSVQACDGERVRARRLSQERSAQLALIVDQDQAPVEESALPELAKVDRDLDVIRSDIDDVMWHDLVPCEDRVMGTWQV